MIQKKFEEILKHCAETNTKQFNIFKGIEEASEFSEAILKYETKHPENSKRPSKKDILDEYGDFIYRGMIVLKMYFPDKSLEEITKEVTERISYKLGKLEEYKKEEKYKKGL